MVDGRMAEVVEYGKGASPYSYIRQGNELELGLVASQLTHHSEIRMNEEEERRGEARPVQPPASLGLHYYFSQANSTAKKRHDAAK